MEYTFEIGEKVGIKSKRIGEYYVGKISKIMKGSCLVYCSLSSYLYFRLPETVSEFDYYELSENETPIDIQDMFSLNLIDDTNNRTNNPYFITLDTEKDDNKNFRCNVGDYFIYKEEKENFSVFNVIEKEENGVIAKVYTCKKEPKFKIDLPINYSTWRFSSKQLYKFKKIDLPDSPEQQKLDKVAILSGLLDMELDQYNKTKKNVFKKSAINYMKEIQEINKQLKEQKEAV